jgi:hypothetical protein
MFQLRFKRHLCTETIFSAYSFQMMSFSNIFIKGSSGDTSFTFHAKLFFHCPICLVFLIYIYIYLYWYVLPGISYQFILEDVLVHRYGRWG